LLKEHKVDFPAELEELKRLSPFAVEFRYDLLPWGKTEEITIDFGFFRELVRSLRKWAEKLAQG